MTAAFDRLINEPILARNFPESPISVSEIRAGGYRLDDLWLPSVVARESAIAHNIARFKDWCEEKNVELAPHGKTSMAPQLWRRQLGNGAWGITAATVAQARIMCDYGTETVLLANEVIDPRQAEWLAAVNARSGHRYYSLVDSEEGVRLLDDAGAKAGARVPVLVEIGVPGRRTGVRDVDDGLALATAVHRSAHLELAGIEGYEGVLPQNRTERDIGDIAEWLPVLSALTHRVDEAGLFSGTDEIILSAGGSSSPDLAADALTAIDGLSKPARRIIRSGCYITHDHRFYERSSPLRSSAAEDPLVPALSCYAYVNSTPEPGLALLTAGKRDVPVDVDLPIVLRVRGGGGRWREAGDLSIFELNDHHAFVRDPGAVLRVGDVVELGLSHPCTTFDKWRLIPVIDDDATVVDAIVTLF